MINHPEEIYQALLKMKNTTRRYSDHSKIEQRISESFSSRGFDLNEGQASELRQALLSNQLRDVVNQVLNTTGLVVEIEGMMLTDQEPEDNEGVSLNVSCVTINNEKHYSQQALGEAHALLSAYLAKPLATLYLPEGTALPLNNMPTICQAFTEKVVNRMQEIHNEMKNLHATLVRDDNVEGGFASNLEASMDSLELSIDHGLYMTQDEHPKPRR